MRLARLGSPRHLVLLVVVFGLAAFVRLWAAPLSAGPDIAQFWAFADTFHEHGLDFYAYAEAKDGTFPFWGWGCVYPPVWLLILGASLLISPSSMASSQMIDESWRIAAKAPIISADLIIGVLIYWAVPGSKWKKLFFASLWLFHPTAWYESAVFGQFDAIAAAFLLASVILISRGTYRLGFLLAALAVMTKQHTVIPVAIMVIIVLRQTSLRAVASNGMVMAPVIAGLSLPFLATGNFKPYADCVLTPGWAPGYQEPLCYAFSGSSSLLTYLHLQYGWATKGLMEFNSIVLAIAVVAAIALLRFRRITLIQGALVGMMLFIGLNYQINYQYVVVYIPLALLAAAQAVSREERIFTLGLAVLPAVWLWLFNVSFWFWYMEPRHHEAISILERIGWTSSHSDFVYVAFAVTLMCSCLAYVVLVFTRWHIKDPDLSNSVSTP